MKGEQDSADAIATTSNGQDRRRHARYRLSEPMTIRREDGSALAGMSVEISEGGMSAMANGLLRVSEIVELDPVAGGRTSATVRHKLGQLYGFEFVQMSAEQVHRIMENCRKSKLWRHQRQDA